jgi:hypothetical protein
VLKQPKFDDPDMFDDPLGLSVASPVLPRPTFDEAPAQAESLPSGSAPAEVAPHSAQQPAVGYAPPPGGSQYSAPPPPGAAYTPPATGVALHPSVLPLPPAQANTVQATPIHAPADRPVEIQAKSPAAKSRPSAVGRDRPEVPGSGTLGVWMLAALPLLQFAVVYAVFGVLAQPLVPGIQWGILVIPALFSLLFAAADRKKLLDNGHDETPNPVLGILAPLYLIARVAVIGPKSVAPLVAWFLLQAAAVAGVFVLLPTVLAAVISSS